MRQQGGVRDTSGQVLVCRCRGLRSLGGRVSEAHVRRAGAHGALLSSEQSLGAGLQRRRPRAAAMRMCMRVCASTWSVRAHLCW